MEAYLILVFFVIFGVYCSWIIFFWKFFIIYYFLKWFRCYLGVFFFRSINYFSFGVSVLLKGKMKRVDFISLIVWVSSFFLSSVVVLCLWLKRKDCRYVSLWGMSSGVFFLYFYGDYMWKYERLMGDFCLLMI